MMSRIPDFSSDYMEGAHPLILERLVSTNAEKTSGYGTDPYSERARERIRAACSAPNAGVYLLVGGTQTNATVLSAILAPYEGVISVDSGHIATHEAGAIEATGHKVITTPGKDGKLTADAALAILRAYAEDEVREHTVKPGAIYVSHPTEYGTLYTRAELAELSRAAHSYGAKLYLDGARLGYALASAENDLTLPDIAELCDAFYIGGTKCGALFGEAVVFPDPDLVPHFFSIVKQHGALLAKGRIAGIQFDTLFDGEMYTEICRKAIDSAMYLKAALTARGYSFFLDSHTNQQFPIISREKYSELKAAEVGFNTWEHLPDGRVVIRFVTSFMTERGEVDELLAYM